MTVYVDHMAARFGRMIMCHMLADTHGELLAMAERIGLDPKWLQDGGTYREHFDVSKSKRALAVAAGALEISTRQLSDLLAARRHARDPEAQPLASPHRFVWPALYGPRPAEDQPPAQLPTDAAQSAEALPEQPAEE